MRRPQHEGKSRTAKCPKCGKLFSAQGLNGHLRFTHGLVGENVKTATAEAAVSKGLAQRGRQAREIIDELKTVRQDLAALKPTDGSEPDGTTVDACELLAARELELRNEIRKLSGKRPMVRVEKESWWSGKQIELIEEPEPPAQ